MLQSATVIFISGVATLIKLDQHLPEADQVLGGLILSFAKLYGVFATGVPIFAYLSHQFTLRTAAEFTAFVGFGTILMVLPLIIIETRADHKRRANLQSPT